VSPMRPIPRHAQLPAVISPRSAGARNFLARVHGACRCGTTLQAPRNAVSQRPLRTWRPARVAAVAGGGGVRVGGGNNKTADSKSADSQQNNF